MTLQLPLEGASLYPDLPLRGGSYVWATWVASYLAGDTHCEWSLWVRARYQNWKAPEAADGDQMALWHVNHTALLRQVVAEARARGEQVWVESQNAFRLVVPPGTALAGKPDLVTMAADRTITVIDAKTGQRKPSHVVQVMLYQWALSQADSRFPSCKIAGRVVYSDGAPPVQLPPSVIDAVFESRVLACLAQCAAITPPQRFPSRQECRFCPVSQDVCPERVEWDIEDRPPSF